MKQLSKLHWIRWSREESRDTFAESYKGFSIYLAIPNGGIVGGSIVDEKSHRKAWVYSSEYLQYPHYLDSDWHIKQCRKKIDSLLSRKKRSSKQLPYEKQLSLFEEEK